MLCPALWAQYAPVGNPVSKPVVLSVGTSPARFTRQAIGSFGEELVAAHYESLGWEVARVAKSNGQGLDVVVFKRDTLRRLYVGKVVEVKTSGSGTAGPLRTTRNGRQLSWKWVDNHTNGMATSSNESAAEVGRTLKHLRELKRLKRELVEVEMSLDRVAFSDPTKPGRLTNSLSAELAAMDSRATNSSIKSTTQRLTEELKRAKLSEVSPASEGVALEEAALKTGSRFPVRLMGKLLRGGLLVVPLAIAGAEIVSLTSDRQKGLVTDREYFTALAQASGGGVGGMSFGAVGWWLGGMAGSLLGPAGTIVGGFVLSALFAWIGDYLGSVLGGHIADSYFDSVDASVRQATENWLGQSSFLDNAQQLLDLRR